MDGVFERVANFSVKDYDLEATLNSGQAFRWEKTADGWEGVINGRWARLSQKGQWIRAEVTHPVQDWSWLRDYLQLDCNIEGIVATFPDDPPMTRATRACHGLRLLRQDPWECLASFILSSSKQIRHIRELIRALSKQRGKRITVPEGRPPWFSFPTPEAIAADHEEALRQLKLGFRAPYLLEAARYVSSGQLNLEALFSLPLEQARAELMRLSGVGFKIADCVLLFAYGFHSAFPIDVWMIKSLQANYFGGKRVPLKELQAFAENHFGSHRDYAQQYLFHYQRMGNSPE